MVNGKASRPFSAITLPPPKIKKSYKEGVVKLSRLKYARGRKEVEKEILYSLALAGQSSSSGNKQFQAYLYPFLKI